jgi:Flp pilus assembly pilin Flp
MVSRKGVVMELAKKLAWFREGVLERTRRGCALMQTKVHALRDERGQGTTEYAILVGVLVVIAIIAITVFRPKIQSLWDAIASGINSL